MRESPMISIWDGDKLVGLQINQPVATSPTPTKLEIELVRIFNEHKQLQAESKKLKAFIKWGERKEVYKHWLKEQALNLCPRQDSK